MRYLVLRQEDPASQIGHVATVHAKRTSSPSRHSLAGSDAPRSTTHSSTAHYSRHGPIAQGHSVQRKSMSRKEIGRRHPARSPGQTRISGPAVRHSVSDTDNDRGNAA